MSSAKNYFGIFTLVSLCLGHPMASAQDTQHELSFDERNQRQVKFAPGSSEAVATKDCDEKISDKDALVLLEYESALAAMKKGGITNEDSLRSQAEKLATTYLPRLSANAKALLVAKQQMARVRSLGQAMEQNPELAAAFQAFEQALTEHEKQRDSYAKSGVFSSLFVNSDKKFRASGNNVSEKLNTVFAALAKTNLSSQAQADLRSRLLKSTQIQFSADDGAIDQSRARRAKQVAGTKAVRDVTAGAAMIGWGLLAAQPHLVTGGAGTMLAMSASTNAGSMLLASASTAMLMGGSTLVAGKSGEMYRSLGNESGFLCSLMREQSIKDDSIYKNAMVSMGIGAVLGPFGAIIPGSITGLNAAVDMPFYKILLIDGGLGGALLATSTRAATGETPIDPQIETQLREARKQKTLGPKAGAFRQSLPEVLSQYWKVRGVDLNSRILFEGLPERLLRRVEEESANYSPEKQKAVENLLNQMIDTHAQTFSVLGHAQYNTQAEYDHYLKTKDYTGLKKVGDGMVEVPKLLITSMAKDEILVKEYFIAKSSKQVEELQKLLNQP